VRVAFATATVDAAALLRWRIGDVIAFDTPLTAAARLTVGGRARRGPARHRRHARGVAHRFRGRGRLTR
jgi:hypothetical protein